MPRFLLLIGKRDSDALPQPQRAQHHWLVQQVVSQAPTPEKSQGPQGRDIGQLALLFGANDMGSLMIEENVVSAAGTVHHLTLEEMKTAISELGWTPRRRNVFYELFEDEPVVVLAGDQAARAGFMPLPLAVTSP